MEHGLDFAVPAGLRVAAAHSHDGFDETIYGLDGVLTWTVDDTRTAVGQGDALLIPRGVIHRFVNEGDVITINTETREYASRTK